MAEPKSELLPEAEIVRIAETNIYLIVFCKLHLPATIAVVFLKVRSAKFNLTIPRSIE